MTFAELANKVLQILPDATFDEDNDGQLVIYTGKTTAMVNGVELVTDMKEED
jgi:hypothetical protein